MNRISKEEWDKLSIDEKEHFKLEYSKDVWRFKKKLLIISRVIAILLILSIFWIGIIQYYYVQDIRELQGEHGDDIWCYMCGLKGGRDCDCVYFNNIELKNLNFTKKLQELANNNIIPCKKKITGFDNMNNINLTSLQNLTILNS